MSQKPSDVEEFCGEEQSIKPAQESDIWVTILILVWGNNILWFTTLLLTKFFGYSIEFEGFVIGGVVFNAVLVFLVENLKRKAKPETTKNS